MLKGVKVNVGSNSQSVLFFCFYICALDAYIINEYIINKYIIMTHFTNKYIKLACNYIKKNKLLILIITIIILLLYIIYSIYMRTRAHRVVVFDLDETLGNFMELGVFCDTVEKYKRTKLTSVEFNNIMDLFPIFLRTDIIKILAYLKTQKQRGTLDKVFIYTNNNGPKEWAERIKNYLEHKINYKLFDRIIGAYKVNGRLMEAGRTTHNKTVNDFLSITKLPRHTKICFIYDVYHEEMDGDNVIYLHVKPYHASLPPYKMAERYYEFNSNSKSTIANDNDNDKDKATFIRFVVTNMNKYNIDTVKNKNEDDEKERSREILDNLKNFLKQPKRKTQNNKSLKHRLSRKR